MKIKTENDDLYQTNKYKIQSKSPVFFSFYKKTNSEKKIKNKLIERFGNRFFTI